MTGKAVDYSTTEVSFYRFVCNDPEIKSSYVGHTINFIARKAHHKKCCNGEHYRQHNQKIYQMIRQHLGWSNWRMIEIEKRIVKDKREAERIEQEYMEQLQSDMNMIKSHRVFETEQEYNKKYREEHKEEIAIQRKAYRKEHKEEIAIRDKSYYQRKKNAFEESCKEAMETILMSQEDKRY